MAAGGVRRTGPGHPVTSDVRSFFEEERFRGMPRMRRLGWGWGKTSNEQPKPNK